MKRSDLPGYVGNEQPDLAAFTELVHADDTLRLMFDGPPEGLAERQRILDDINQTTDPVRARRKILSYLDAHPDMDELVDFLYKIPDGDTYTLPLFADNLRRKKARFIPAEHAALMHGHYEKFINGRVVLSALYYHALTHVRALDYEAAIPPLEEYLKLSRADHEGARDFLALAYALLDRHRPLAALFERYADDERATWLYLKALSALKRDGYTAATRDLLTKAEAANAYVLPFFMALVNGTELPNDEHAVAVEPGSMTEAQHVLNRILPIVGERPDALVRHLTSAQNNSHMTSFSSKRDIRRVNAHIEAANFETKEALEAFMARFRTESVDEVLGPDTEPLGVEERAENLVEQARKVTGEAARELLNQALELDPNCVAAYELRATLAFESSGWDSEEGLANVVDTVSAARRRYEAYLTGRTGQEVTHEAHHKRTYAQTLITAATLLRFSQRTRLALPMWEDLLDLHAGEHQRAVLELAAAYLETGRTQDYRELYADYADERHPVWLFCRALYLFNRLGGGGKALQALKKAKRANGLVIPYLCHAKPLPEDGDIPDGGAPGSDLEAINTTFILMPTYSRYPKSKDWIARYLRR